MAATKGQMNWTGVSWNSTTITRVNSVSVSQGGELLEYAGDTDVYNTIIVANAIKPTVSIETSDPAVFLGFTPGVSSTLAATWKDVKGSAGGDVVFAITGAVYETSDAQGQRAQLGTATGKWKCVTADGITNPIGISRS